MQSSLRAPQSLAFTLSHLLVLSPCRSPMNRSVSVGVIRRRPINYRAQKWRRRRAFEGPGQVPSGFQCRLLVQTGVWLDGSGGSSKLEESPSSVLTAVRFVYVRPFEWRKRSLAAADRFRKANTCPAEGEPKSRSPSHCSPARSDTNELTFITIIIIIIIIITA